MRMRCVLLTACPGIFESFCFAHFRRKLQPKNLLLSNCCIVCKTLDTNCEDWQQITYLQSNKSAITIVLFDLELKALKA